MNRRQLPYYCKCIFLANLLIGATVATSALAQTTYEYDELGRLIKVEDARQSKVTDYDYDAAGNRSSVSLTALGAPVFSVSSASANEGSVVSFAVSRSGDPGIAVSVDYASSDSSAAEGSDYTAASGTLNFLVNETSKNIDVTTTQDSVYEGNETFTLTLSNASAPATIGAAIATGTINDDDGAPSFSVNNVSIAEGGNLSFTVTKSGSSSQTHNVNYATANGTAASGSDYTSKSGTLSFTSEETSKTVTVVTLGDSVYENNETVNVNLSAATGGATISDSQGVGTINNDDAAPAFSVNNVSVTEGGTLSFTVTKSGSTALSHNINYATSNGTAAAGSDYTAKSGTLTFTSGQTSQSVSVTTIQDSTVEANETVNLNLSAATNGATISDSLGIGTINNDDAANSPPVAVSDSIAVIAFGTYYLYPLANDTDPDGDPITLSTYTAPTGLIVQWDAALKRMTITGTQAGVYVISYDISDGNGGTDTGFISVSVTDAQCGETICIPE